jgi:Trk K+ transport system NAD-binding subunit
MRILIAGGGQVATLVAARLIREGNEITIVEENPERCAECEQALDAKIVQGNAASIRTLHEAGIRDAEMLIAAPGSKYLGRKLRDLRLPRGTLVGAIARPDGEVIVPRGDASIEAGDRVLFFSLESAVPALETAFLAEPRRKAR